MGYVIAFFVFAMVVFIGVYLIERKRRAVLDLAARLGIKTFDDVVQEDLRGHSFMAALLDYLRQRFGAALPGFAVEEYDRKLMWAGNPFNLTGEEFYLIKIVLGLLPPIIIPVVWLLGGGRSTVLLLLILGICMYFLPDFWLTSKAKSRQRQIVKELFPFIDVLAICSDAGLNLSEAIKHTVEVQAGVLSSEFKRFQRDLDAGSSRSEALNDLAYRNGVEELSNLVLAINQAEKYGTPVAKMLREQVRMMRIQRRNKAQEAAQTASVKILLPMIVFDFMPLLVVLLGPAIINLGRALNL
jgi:pilus assembly protein TadC